MAFDFPNAPTIGQTYQGYVYDGEKWISTSSPAAPNQSGVISIQVFTASGQYIPSANMTTCVIECVGGGGGGGGGGSAAGNSALGGGGGGGGYSSMTTGAATIGISQVVTIGTAGAAGAAGANNGGNGGDTSVGALCIAKGGSAGVGSPGNTQAAGGNGGVAGTGTIAIPGGRGGTGLGYGVNTIYSPPTNTGGASGKNFGAGGYAPITSAGGPGQNYGGGGGGGNSFNAVSSQPGGAGAPGLVVVTEYGMTALSPATAQLGGVRYDLPQGLTANQTAQARANIWVTKKNYIVNGAMMVSQENGSTGGSTNAYYPVDQFFLSFAASAGQYNTAQQFVTTPAGSPARLAVSCGVALASLAASDCGFIQTSIEGLRVADLMWGTANAKTVTLQFGVYGPAGTYGVSFFNNAANRFYLGQFIIASGEANTIVLKTITVPGDTAGTWTTDNTKGISVRWGVAAGANFQGATGAWSSTNNVGPVGQFNLLSVVGNIFLLFDVSLTEGTVAPPFQVPDYASELALCKRYFWRRNFLTTEYAGSMAAYSTTGFAGPCFVFQQEMRSAPTATMLSAAHYNVLIAGGSGVAVTALNLTTSINAVNGSGSVGSGLAAVNSAAMYANTPTWMQFNARL